MEEIWKSIKNYEGLYDASNYGRIRSLDHWRDNGTGRYIQKGRIMNSVKTKKGYLRVQLCKNGKQKHFLVHRLVYEAFNGAIPDGYEVNHINEDKTDCSLDNMNLLTHGQNMNWGTRNKRVSEKLTNGKLSDPVLQLTLDDVLVKEWPSMREAGRHGFDSQNISKCCNGKLKSHKGFKWVKKNTYSV